jgi:hypothetical protein
MAAFLIFLEIIPFFQGCQAIGLESKDWPAKSGLSNSREGMGYALCGQARNMDLPRQKKTDASAPWLSLSYP